MDQKMRQNLLGPKLLTFYGCFILRLKVYTCYILVQSLEKFPILAQHFSCTKSPIRTASLRDEANKMDSSLMKGAIMTGFIDFIKKKIPLRFLEVV